MKPLFSPGGRRGRDWLVPLILVVSLCLSSVLPSRASDTGFVSQMEEFDELTLESVVDVTFRRNSNIRLQDRQVVQSRGEVRTAKGQFDYTLQSTLSNQVLHDPRPGTNLDDPPEHVTSLEFNLMKTLRTGTQFGPRFRVNRTDDDSLPDAGTPGTPPQPIYSGEVGFQLVQPLLRGAGPEAVTAQEDASIFRFRASKSSYENTIASELRTSVTAFWQYLAAKEQLEIRRESVERTRQLMEQTETLIDHDERPRADLEQVEAQLSDKRSARIRAEQQYLEARQNLGVSIGIPFEYIDRIPDPSGEFPPGTVYDRSEVEDQTRFLRHALAERGDLLAVSDRIRANRRLLDQAENQEWQNLDLSFDVYYQGVERGVEDSTLYYEAYDRNRSDLNIESTLTFEWPVRSREAEGRTQQRRAAYERELIRKKSLRRRIKSGVKVALAEVRSRYESLRQAKRSVESFRSALENEREKYQLGTSTLVDVISTEDRLTEATLNLIRIRQQFAIALIDLRYQAGLLYTGDGSQKVLDSRRLKTFPDPPDPEYTGGSQSVTTGRLDDE